MSKPLMKCGHAANAVDGQGRPCCVICIGINAGAVVPADEMPDLSGRKACCGCGCTVDSSLKLAFFEHLPALPQDRFYCGCMGWD